MKQKSVLLTIAVLLGLRITATAQTPPSYVPTDGLVGWWPFNGNANDESGNGNDGTVNGATLTEDRFGVADAAYDFDGLNDRIEVPSLNGDYQNFSISLWLKSSSSEQSQQVFFAHSDHLNSNNEIIALAKSSSDLFLGFKQNSNCIAGQGWNFITGSITSSFNNVWNHLVVVFSGLNKSTYLNGFLLAQSSIVGGIDYCSNSNVRFGSYNADFPQWYSGDLDDIGIWNRALTQEEVTNLFNASAPSSISSSHIDHNLNIFPNPTEDRLTLEFGKGASLNGYALVIENSLGQQVYEAVITQQMSNISMVSLAGKGLYFVRIFDTQGNAVHVRKVVVE